MEAAGVCVIKSDVESGPGSSHQSTNVTTPQKMKKDLRFLTAQYIFDGSTLLENHVIVVHKEAVKEIVSIDQWRASRMIQTDVGEIEDMGIDSVLSCGMLDLQMNGGGGKQFNEDISMETLETMYQVCQKHGTTGFLPSMISSSFEDSQQSLEVVKQWVDKYGLTRGVIGIHLEGPFISKDKKGIHSEQLIQEPMRSKFEIIARYAQHFPILMTVAPEKLSSDDTKYLSSNGVVLSVGHTNCTYEQAMKCFDDGARSVTHLYNAMSGLTGRDPGLIGAVLNREDCYSAIIPDLHHVHQANVSIAAKLKPEHMFLVTDCHAPAGTDIKEFDLTGRHMYVKNGMCCDIEGRLSGSNILMNEGLRNCVQACQISLTQALKMATINAAKALNVEHLTGKIKVGLPIDQLISINIKDFSCQVIKPSNSKPILVSQRDEQ